MFHPLGRLRVDWLPTMARVVLAVATMIMLSSSDDPDRHGLHLAWGGEPRDERVLKRPGIDKRAQAKIDAAIERGAAFLRGSQRQDGAFCGGDCDYQDPLSAEFLGQTLLCALALQKVGGEANADSVERAAGWCFDSGGPRSRRIERYVYAAGVGLTLACGLPTSSYAGVRTRLVNALVAGQDRATGWWGYDTPGGDHDFAYAVRNPGSTARPTGFDAFEPNLSTTQYAVMGLRAASRVGVEVPRRTWSRHIDAMIATQTRSGSWPYRPTDTGESARVFDRVGYCCGTFMGLVSLITSAELELSGSRPTPGREAAVADATARARAALWRDGRMILRDPWVFDPDAVDRDAVARSRESAASPGSGAFYTLLALERSCIFLGVERLAAPSAGRIPKGEQAQLDAEGMWYEVGSRWLVQRQSESGGWAARPSAAGQSNLLDSAMALLFLLGSLDDAATVTPGAASVSGGPDQK